MKSIKVLNENYKITQKPILLKRSVVKKTGERITIINGFGRKGE